MQGDLSGRDYIYAQNEFPIAIMIKKWADADGANADICVPLRLAQDDAGLTLKERCGRLVERKR